MPALPKPVLGQWRIRFTFPSRTFEDLGSGVLDRPGDYAAYLAWRLTKTTITRRHREKNFPQDHRMDEFCTEPGPFGSCFTRGMAKTPHSEDQESDRGVRRRVLAVIQSHGSYTRLQKPVLDLKGFLTPTLGDYSTQSGSTECECGTPAGDHPLLPSKSAHAAQTAKERPPMSSQSCTEVKDKVEVSAQPECRYSILGHFHQCHIPDVWSPSRHPGTQCTSVAFSAIVASTVVPVGLWTPATLDGVLVMGDRLHDAILGTLGNWAPPSKHLSADEMIEDPEDAESRWPVRCGRVCEIQGLLYPDSMDTNSLRSQLTWEWMPGQPLREFGDAMGRLFNAQDCQGAIITLDGRSSALLQNPAGGWMVVDSHAKDVLGTTNVDGKSSLLRFPSLSHVVAYYSGMAVRPTQYSLTGFKVERMSEGE